MKLKEYLFELSKLVRKNPQALELQVVHSSDDEGNSFHPVIATPCLGVYGDNEFDTDSRNSVDPPNAVCIN